MRYCIPFALLFLLAGCVNFSFKDVYKALVNRQPELEVVQATLGEKYLETAEQYLGFTETSNRQELIDLMVIDPVETEWCAAFVNAILNVNNIPGSDEYTDSRYLARSFMKWGNEVNPGDIQKGDIIVFPRGNQGWQGHVAFFVDYTLKDGVLYFVVLGGNQSDSVSYEEYKVSSALGVRRFEKTVAQQF